METVKMPEFPDANASPDEMASHTRDLLIQMQKMAQQQNQMVLAHLLSLAAEEARTLKKDYKQDTLPPG